MAAAMNVDGCAPTGLESMEDMREVAIRMNGGIFKQASLGCAARIAGRIENETGCTRITATDGEVVSVAAAPGCNLSSLSGIVEVVGTKQTDGLLQVAGAIPLGKIDVEMWDQAVRMSHKTQLQHMFEPSVTST